jgi:hypothetical protein
MLKVTKARLKELEKAGVYHGQTTMAPTNSISELLDGLLPEEKVIKLVCCFYDDKQAVFGITTSRVIIVHSSALSMGTTQKDFEISKITSIGTKGGLTNTITIQTGSDKIEAKGIVTTNIKEIINAARNPESFSAYSLEELFPASLDTNLGNARSGSGSGKKALRYIGVVMFGLMGLGWIISGPSGGDYFLALAGVLSLTTAIFLTPYMAKFFSRKIRISTAVGALFMVMILASLSSQESQERKALQDAEANKIFATLKPLLAEQKFDSAAQLAREIKEKYSDKTNNPATEFLKEYESLKNDSFFNERLVSISDQKFDSLKAGLTTGDFLTDSVLNSLFTARIIKNQALRVKLLKEKEEAEELAAKKEAAEKRQKNIESQFSAYDGSHRNFERVIKASMNDEDSYEHIETKYWDMGDHLIIQTSFSGKNAFNATVKNYMKARVSLEGQVLEILK